MSKEDQHLDENEESTLNEECESKDASEEIDSLFEDSKEDSQEDSEDESKEKSDEESETEKEKPVSRAELERLEKGIKKIASELGRDKVEKTTESGDNPVLRKLYFKATPEAELVWEEVEKEAKLLGKDPYQLYEQSSYFKGEAKSRAEAKEVEEKSKEKVNKPSSDTDFSKKISDYKAEDVEKMTPSQKTKWIKFQAEKERNSDE